MKLSPGHPREELLALTAHRWRIAIALTAAMTLVYFGFMLLVAYAKHWLGSEVAPGLSWGILLGALVILSAWLLTFIYVRWANAVYDPRVRELRERAGVRRDG